MSCAQQASSGDDRVHNLKREQISGSHRLDGWIRVSSGRLPWGVGCKLNGRRPHFITTWRLYCIENGQVKKVSPFSDLQDVVAAAEIRLHAAQSEG